MQCEVHDKLGNHCQNKVIHKFRFNGKDVYLCSQCFANVCSGAYGIDLQLSALNGAKNTEQQVQRIFN